MKLTTYNYQGSPHLGVLLNADHIINLPQAYAAFQANNGNPGAIFPTDMLAFLSGGEATLAAAAATLDWVNTAQAEPVKAALTLPLHQVRIVAPLYNPSKIICIGLNYHDHCRETGTAVPTSPVTFVKYPSAIIGPGENITWQSEASTQVDYEAELAFVIKRKARHVSPDDAYGYIAGYTILNDISARDVQFSEGQWVRAKSFDTFCPLGPYLVTPDDVGDPHQLGIRCRLNQELVQDSNTGELIFKIPELIAFLTKTCTLMPGDIVSTGTPHGTGAFRNPPIYLKPGDVVEVEIDKLGSLRNPVV